MQYDNLPKELRDNGKFCLWKYEERKGKAKPGKVLLLEFHPDLPFE